MDNTITSCSAMSVRASKFVILKTPPIDIWHYKDLFGFYPYPFMSFTPKTHHKLRPQHLEFIMIFGFPSNTNKKLMAEVVFFLFFMN